MLSGISKLPKDMSSKHALNYFAVEIEVDPVDSKVVDASCTLVPVLAEKILVSILLNARLEEGVKSIIEEIDARLFCNTKKEIIVAVKDVYAKYIKYRKKVAKIRN